MYILFYIIAVYLALGALFLILFNLRTHRIKRNLDDAVAEAQVKITNASMTFNGMAGPAGQMPPVIAGKKVIVVLLLLASWLTWPLVLIGYIKSKRGEENAE